MSSPGIHPRDNEPAAGPSSKNGAQQKLRVLSGDNAPPTRAPGICAFACPGAPAAPSIAMPQATTELSELLAGDNALCVRRPQSSAAPRGERCPDDGDGDLACLIDAWPGLPRNIRAAVLALIREDVPRARRDPFVDLPYLAAAITSSPFKIPLSP